MMFFWIIFLMIPVLQLHSENWYSEYWQRLSWEIFERNEFSMKLYGEFRTGNKFRNIYYLHLTDQLAYKVSENLKLELHYTYIHSRSVVPDSLWNWQHRLELEVNPSFQLSKSNLIATRNRLEIRKIQTDSKIQFRLRHRTMLIFPIENRGCLKAYSLHNEIFYDFSIDRFSQNRFCPINLTFALSEKVDFDLFCLLQIFISQNIWRRNAVIGTQFSF